jgi:hypothetical protein
MTYGLKRPRLKMRVAFHPCTDAWMRGYRYGEVRGWRGTGALCSVLVRPDRSAKNVRVYADLLAEVTR